MHGCNGLVQALQSNCTLLLCLPACISITLRCITLTIENTKLSSLGEVHAVTVFAF